MKEEYIIEYTKVDHFDGKRVRERHYHQSLDDVFEMLRYSKYCKREKYGLDFVGIAYKEKSKRDGTIQNNFWVNEDISIKPMTDEDKE